jgi:paraquat-inducible protein A
MKKRWQKSLFNLLLITAAVLLIIGIFAPMMTLQKFYFLENTVSLRSTLLQLFWQSEWLLFVLILFLSVIFPIVKLMLLFLLLNVFEDTSKRHKKYLRRLSMIGKWSMLDVFVVAMLLVTIKLDLVASVQVHYGLYAFAGSVLLTMVLNQWMEKVSSDAEDRS